jgi:hypothetical protein
VNREYDERPLQVRCVVRDNGWLRKHVRQRYFPLALISRIATTKTSGGIVASNVFLDHEQPNYRTGYGVSLDFLWICGAACTVLLFVATRENKKWDRGARNYRLNEPDADNRGDDHPHFRLAT